VLLPTPYALSNKNKWPSVDGKKYIFDYEGQKYVEHAVSFQEAYIAAAIKESGGKQFHMRHSDYSEQVKDVLDGIAAKMKKMIRGECNIAAESKEGGKIDAPLGLVARLNALLAQLKVLLIGPVWHKKYYGDDKLMTDYFSLVKAVKGLKADIVNVM